MRQVAVQTEPDKTLGELVDGKEQGQRGKQDLAGVLDLPQCRDAYNAENTAADEVCCGGKAHEARSTSAAKAARPWFALWHG